MKSLMFHVRHNARPNLVKEVLEILAGNEELSLDNILSIGARREYQIGTVIQSEQSLKENPVQMARDLGLIEDKRLILTSLGKDIISLLHYKPSSWGEIMHILFYTRWTPFSETENCFSWSYRTLCDILWEAGSVTIDRGHLVSLISELAMERFNTTQVSFSKDSVRGVLQWLQELQLAVLDRDSKVFNRRTFCPPESFILAVNYLYRSKEIDYQTNLLLDDEKQEIICKLCLLETTAFEATLEWATGQYPFLQWRSNGGWGSYILLTRQPEIQDFLG